MANIPPIFDKGYFAAIVENIFGGHGILYILDC
jgi:hypothetical protein